MTLAYSELNGFPQEWWAQDQFKAKRKLRCLWGLRFQVAHSLVAGPTGFGEPYPYKPDSGARAINASIVGFGGFNQEPGATDRATYEEAHVTVNYETPRSTDEHSAGGGRSDGVIEQFESTAEMLRLPHERYSWRDDTSLRPDEAPALLDVGGEYVLTLTRLTSIPAHVWWDVGRVNDRQLATRTPGFAMAFAKETLLKLTPRVEHSFNATTGISTIQVTYRFAIKARSGKDENDVQGVWGWNHVLRVRSPELPDRYERIYKRRQLPPSGPPMPANPYQLADFSAH
jgi:hypothetical protein